jgi:hypothetical protein
MYIIKIIKKFVLSKFCKTILLFLYKKKKTSIKKKCQIR